MRFLNKKNIMFISLILALNILLMLVFKYKYSQKYIQELSNQFYSTNSIEFFDSNINKHFDILKSKTNYRIFVELDDTFRFFKYNDKNWSPPILEGEFFSLNTTEKTAVVGKNLLDIIQNLNGSNVIKFNNEYYKVIGIMGESFPTKIDSLVLLTSDSPPQLNNAKIVIDSENKTLIKHLSNQLKSNYNITLLEKEDLGLNKLVKSDFFSKLFVSITVLIVIFSICVYLRYWFEKQIAFLRVLNLLGFRRKKIICIFLINIFFNILISIIFTAIIILLSNKFFTFNMLILSSLFTSTITLSISIIYIFSWAKAINNLRRRIKI